MTEASGEPRAVVVHGGPSRGRHGGRVLLLLLLFPPVPVETGWMVLLQFTLQVANVVDDVLDDFQLGDFAILGNVRHQQF
jgi:hypothetical protein